MPSSLTARILARTWLVMAALAVTGQIAWAVENSWFNTLLDGIIRIQATTTEGKPLTFIPYFLWGNRGSSKMTVWVNT